jgi:hypothetical protein
MSSSSKGRWFAVVLPAVLLLGLCTTAVLHIGLKIPWMELVFPVGAFIGLQLCTFVGMFWAGNRGRTQGKYGAAIVLAGLYCWGTGWLVIHYGTEWGILSHHSNDLLAFSVFMILVGGITFALFSRLKGRLKSSK